MKCVYRATGLEAHMLAGMLEQLGIVAQVQGDMLQGAVGELPAADLASIWVAEEDEARALAVIRDYQDSQPAEPATVSSGDAAGQRPAPFLRGLLIGVICGFALALWLLGSVGGR